MNTTVTQRWVAHCHRMAEASYALADWCEDPEMMADYIRLAARWMDFAASGARRAVGRPRAAVVGRGAKA